MSIPEQHTKELCELRGAIVRELQDAAVGCLTRSPAPWGSTVESYVTAEGDLPRTVTVGCGDVVLTSLKVQFEKDGVEYEAWCKNPRVSGEEVTYEVEDA